MQKLVVPPRRIAHLDMDAFYASVELLRRPDLKGKPLAIGGRGDPNSRAVVTTATYEARQYGVQSGVSLYKAKQLCKDLLMLPVDFDEYRRFSKLFKAAVLQVAPRMEDRGIDEVYLDLTAHQEDTQTLAERLRDAVFDATQLSCSIGIAPNKLLAKIGSDLNKPRGITIINYDDLHSKIWPLAVKKINGVGPKATDRLASFGIDTIGQLAQVSPVQLVKHFGRSYGLWLHEVAHGRDEREIVTSSESVSVSRETTFERNLNLITQRQEIELILRDLTVSLARDLARKNVLAKQIGVKIKFEDFQGVTRDVSLREPTASYETMFAAACQCLNRVPTRLGARLIGIKAAQLSPADASLNLPSNMELFG